MPIFRNNPSSRSNSPLSKLKKLKRDRRSRSLAQKRTNPGMSRRYRINPGGLGGGNITPEKIALRYARMRASKAARKSYKKFGSVDKANKAVKRSLRSVKGAYKKALTRAKRKSSAKAAWRRRKSGGGLVIYRGGSSPARKRKKKAVSVAKKRKGRVGSKKKRPSGKRKSAKRVAAGKKAARTRKRKAAARKASRKSPRKYRRKSGRKVGSGRRKRARSRRRTYTKRARRSRAAKRAWRTRRSKGRGRWNRYRGKTLKRARTSIKRARRGKMGKSAKSYARRFKMRSNPGLGGVVSMFKGVARAVIPVAIGYVAANTVGNLIPLQLPTLGGHFEPLKGAALLVGANILTDKVGVLRKYKFSIMTGFGLSLVRTLVRTYLPGVAKTLGLGDYVEIPGSMGDYIQTESMGDYVDVSSDYSDVGALEELGNAGVMQEMGSLGSWSPKLLAGAIPTRGNAALIHHRANSMEVPAWAPSPDEEFYQGTFANRLLRDAN